MNEKEVKVTCPYCGEELDKTMYKVTYTEDGHITPTKVDIDLVNHTFDVACPKCGRQLPYTNARDTQDFLNGIKEV
jgi:predicted RNA-binding Zn-ribbon protein involved in translation (DUF1610 family)